MQKRNNIDELLIRMADQIERWDDAEPRSDWWKYQRDFAEAAAQLTQLCAAGDKLAGALERCRSIVEKHNGRQTEKVDGVKDVVAQALTEWKDLTDGQ